jgi:hypothetical protein
MYSIRVASSARNTRPPSIGKAQQVEHGQEYINYHDPLDKRPAGHVELAQRLPSTRPGQPQEQQPSDHDVHRGTGQRDGQFLTRLFGHALEARHAADWQ